MEEFSVCCCDPVSIDDEVYSLWLEGLNEEEAAVKRKHIDSSINVPFAIVLSDTRQQFQLFKLLEKFLQSPLLLKMQMLCTLPAASQHSLNERYYGFDKDVIREILGKKVSAKLRKDMDDVSEKTGIPLKRCRRQFDNIKNILKAYEESDGCALEVIQKQFLFSEKLADIYSLIVFIFVNRFDTSRKRLSYLTFDDFTFCSKQMLKHWTIQGGDSSHATSDSAHEDDELDRNFFQEVRDLKNIICDKDINDRFKHLVIKYLEEKSFIGLARSTDSIFRNLTQKIFNIGSSMSNSRDVREFFNHSVEKIIEPMKQVEWTKYEFEMFLEALVNVGDDLKQISRSYYPRLYSRFMVTMKECLVQLYHS